MIVIRNAPHSFFPGMCHPWTGVKFVHYGDETAVNDSYENEKQQEVPVPVYSIRKVHVSETQDSFHLLLDLPGVKEQDVTLTLQEDTLLVDASRKRGDKVVAKYHRTFPLEKKNLVLNGIQASLADGVLAVILPKRTEAETNTLSPVSEEAPETTDDMVQFALQVPGVKAKDMKIDVKYDEIVINAERTVGGSKSEIKRRLSVDQDKIDLTQVQAYLMDGILTLVAPKKEETPMGTRTIPINAPTPQVQGEVETNEIVVETVVDKNEGKHEEKEKEQEWETVEQGKH